MILQRAFRKFRNFKIQRSNFVHFGSIIVFVYENPIAVTLSIASNYAGPWLIIGYDLYQIVMVNQGPLKMESRTRMWFDIEIERGLH